MGDGFSQRFSLASTSRFDIGAACRTHPSSKGRRHQSLQRHGPTTPLRRRGMQPRRSCLTGAVDLCDAGPDPASIELRAGHGRMLSSFELPPGTRPIETARHLVDAFVIRTQLRPNCGLIWPAKATRSLVETSPDYGFWFLLGRCQPHHDAGVFEKSCGSDLAVLKSLCICRNTMSSPPKYHGAKRFTEASPIVLLSRLCDAPVAPRPYRSQASACDAPSCHVMCTWVDVVPVPVRPPRAPLSGNWDWRCVKKSRPLHGSSRTNPESAETCYRTQHILLPLASCGPQHVCGLIEDARNEFNMISSPILSMQFRGHRG